MRLFLVSNPSQRSGLAVGAPMLGVSEMSAAMHTDASANDASADEKMETAGALLKRVLDLLDSAEAPPELAARVQEALDAVAEYRTS